MGLRMDNVLVPQLEAATRFVRRGGSVTASRNVVEERIVLVSGDIILDSCHNFADLDPLREVGVRAPRGAYADPCLCSSRQHGTFSTKDIAVPSSDTVAI